ncbi:endonuclease/exonuclease/phosphatase family protein [Candidatus Pacearchaeota archaeon]|nr:hypothetical protein [uncultured archaeon]MBS3084545.1 endonuclease/exonuclease/phosphatase family protein [Candidatus Pacearchaeota archaeon]
MEVKIFNLNCWLLPSPFSAENEKRLYRIISLIKKYSPDIITLQEVWLKKYVRKLKREFPDYHFFSLKSSLFNKSGLVSGFKMKPLSFSGEYFPLTKIHNLREKIALKGYQASEISPGVFIINTQLYTPEKPSDLKITLSQFKKIEAFSSGKKVIISGDLNIEEDEFLRANKTFFYKSPLGFTVARKNYYCNSRVNQIPRSDKTIDYIISNEKSIAPKTKIFNPVTVSDHYPMFGIFDL